MPLRSAPALAAALLVVASWLVAACDDDGPRAPATPAATATATILRSSAGGATALQAANDSPLPSGISVREIGSGTLRADRAFAVAIFYPRAPGAARSFAAKDRDSLYAALAALGVRPEAILTEAGPAAGPFTTVRVEIPIADLPTRGRPILDAVERVLGRADATGAAFAISSCATAADALRRDTFAMASERAKALGAAAGVTLGPLAGVTEQRPTGAAFADPCADALPTLKGGPVGLQPLDSAPLVPVQLELVVTYRIAGTTAEGHALTVAGAGRATADADTAHVVLMVERSVGASGTPTLETRDRAEVIDRMVSLGIARDDVEIVAGTGSLVVVSIEVPLARLAKLGPEIADAVTRTLGRAVAQGASFTHSDCERVRAAAHKQALADARARALSLATAGGGRLGALRSVHELAPGAASELAGDPCHPTAAGLATGAYGGALQPFDAKPEFTVETAVAVTYTLD
jgi:uncharacterized protein YggE